MKSRIRLCLMAMALLGCAVHRAHVESANKSSTDATTVPSFQGEPASGVVRAPSLMEHRLVSIAVEVPSTKPTTRPKRYPAQEHWKGATVEAEFPFTELLPSWNVIVPENAGVRWDVRVRDAQTKRWSPWLYIGYWGRVTHDHRTTEFDGGKVEIDVLRLTSPADAFEMRATGMSFDLPEPKLPTVRRAQAVYSRPVPSGVVAGMTPLVASATTRPAATDLDLPFRPQGIEDKCISSSICSPTSVSMVLQWAGIDRPTQENALTIWDDDYALFGNWNRAVQYASSLGLESGLERFTTMDQVRARLAEGQPIIASIKFEPGTFRSNVMNSTDGHLIVLRGFNEAGDLIVNDPASSDRGHGIVYKANELAHAWLVNTGGVGYIIRKPSEAKGQAK